MRAKKHIRRTRKNPNEWYTLIGTSTPNIQDFPITQVIKINNISNIPKGIPLWKIKEKAILAANFMMKNPEKNLPNELMYDTVS